MATLEQMVQNVIKRLVMATGSGVQTYAEDRIALILNEAYTTIFDMQFWSWTRMRGTFTLTGTDGTSTVALNGLIKEFRDIEHIWLGKEPNPLPRLSGVFNTQSVRTRCYAPIASNKVVQILPLTQTGTFDITYRTRPDADFEMTDTVPCDEMLLRYKACYDYLIDEGTNEQAVQKFLNLYNQRLKVLQDAEHAGVRLLGSYVDSNFPDQWFDPNA